MSLSEWLESKAGATRLEACELALGRFCAAADADEDYTRQIAKAVWSVCSARRRPIRQRSFRKYAAK